jgi:hypothetical protein
LRGDLNRVAAHFRVVVDDVRKRRFVVVRSYLQERSRVALAAISTGEYARVWVEQTSVNAALTCTAPDATAPARKYTIALRTGEATQQDRSRVAAMRAYSQGVKAYKPGTQAALLKAASYFEETSAIGGPQMPQGKRRQPSRRSACP